MGKGDIMVPCLRVVMVDDIKKVQSLWRTLDRTKMCKGVKYKGFMWLARVIVSDLSLKNKNVIT